MSKNDETKKVKPKKRTFKRKLINSDLAKRISPTTLSTLADNLDDKDALKEILLLLNPFFRVCSLEDFKQLSSAIKRLCKK